MFYFDMDGVLVEYEYDAYIGNEPKYTKLGGHYFLNLKPYTSMLYAFNRMVEQAPDDVYVLTSVSEKTDIKNEQIFDKLKWLTKHSPKFDIGSHFIATSSSKRNTIADIKGMPITKRDILIDDYNPNLFKWMTAGGIAIKCVNGINSADSWPGLSIDIDQDVDSIETTLKNIWYNMLMFGELQEGKVI